MLPLARCQASTTWAGVARYFAARAVTVRLSRSRALAQRAVGLDGDAVLAADAATSRCWKVGWISIWLTAGTVRPGGQQGLQVLRQEVGNAYGAAEALGVHLFERLPRLHIQALRGHRPVDQIQVHKVQTEFPQAVVESLRGPRPCSPLRSLVVTNTSSRGIPRTRSRRRRRTRSGTRRPCRCGGSPLPVRLRPLAAFRPAAPGKRRSLAAGWRRRC